MVLRAHEDISSIAGNMQHSQHMKVGGAKQSIVRVVQMVERLYAIPMI